MQDFQSTVLTCTPSYSLLLAEVGRADGIDFSKLPLRVGLLGAEPWSEGMRKDIQNKLHLKAIDIYGLTEMCGPGVSADCDQHDGLHLWEDHFLVECLDPVTFEPVGFEEEGEIVLTTLTKLVNLKKHPLSSPV